ncbi:pilus assembly protein CpaC [Limimonas halophila]|uniref:Pilus assembly protein CpaC n=1 Tax=Limimonas halophila TaxID=1082479 RepID=A0A1G7PAL2_9PROT|nr:type II and III secretion system protein family protein [Limimonas halophila]SDF83355.1 pilus assembly protein CpaC [Limimonas halophila]
MGARALRRGLAALLVVLAAPAAAQVVDGSTQTVDLTPDEAKVVRLDAPVSSVFVANPDIADVQVKSPRLVYVFAKEVGSTTLFAVGDDDRVAASYKLDVGHDVRGLTRALREMHPDQPIDVRSVEGALVLEGTVDAAAAAEDARRLAQEFADEENIINRIEVNAPTQVNLRVHVAEVERDITESYGVRWDNISEEIFGEVFRFMGGSLSGAAGAFTFGAAGSGGATEAFLDILAEENLVRVLAEPNLTAMSGESASFLAGGEFPIPVGSDTEDGVTDIEIEFKEFGVQLKFMPVILDDRRISLKVSPEVSELNFADGVELSGTEVPAIDTRRASTTIELGSGQTFAIAGLLQQQRQQNLQKLPGLGDVPVLGALFRSQSFQRGQTELAIIVTPYIVEPSQGRDLASPADGMIAPNDIERLFFGRFHGEMTARQQRAHEKLKGRELAGPAGFMLE